MRRWEERAGAALALDADLRARAAGPYIRFAVVNYVKILPYALLDMFPAVNLTTSLALMPAAILGTLLGVWLHKRVNDRLFYRFCYAFVFVAGCKLLFDGVRGVLGI